MEHQTETNEMQEHEYNAAQHQYVEQIGRERHGCVSIYLYMGIVLNGLMSIFALIDSLTGKGGDGMWIKSLILLLNALGFVMLLQWRKSGFILLSVMAIINVIYTCLLSEWRPGNSIMLLSAICGLLVLYLVLQIRRDGKSAWSWLE